VILDFNHNLAITMQEIGTEWNSVLSQFKHSLLSQFTHSCEYLWLYNQVFFKCPNYCLFIQGYYIIWRSKKNSNMNQEILPLSPTSVSTTSVSITSAVDHVCTSVSPVKNLRGRITTLIRIKNTYSSDPFLSVQNAHSNSSQGVLFFVEKFNKRIIPSQVNFLFNEFYWKL